MGTNPRKTAKRIKSRLQLLSAKLAVAESVTAGRVQALLTGISGASEFFEGGVVAYSLEQKVRILGVDRLHAEAVNCVSAEVSGQMAAGVASLFRTQFALGITGYAEPDEAHQIEKPQAHISIWWADGSHLPDASHGKLLRHQFVHAKPGRRTAQRSLARQALALLLATLESME